MEDTMRASDMVNKRMARGRAIALPMRMSRVIEYRKFGLK